MQQRFQTNFYYFNLKNHNIRTTLQQTEVTLHCCWSVVFVYFHVSLSFSGWVILKVSSVLTNSGSHHWVGSGRLHNSVKPKLFCLKYYFQWVLVTWSSATNQTQLYFNHRPSFGRRHQQETHSDINRRTNDMKNTTKTQTWEWKCKHHALGMLFWDVEWGWATSSEILKNVLQRRSSLHWNMGWKHLFCVDFNHFSFPFSAQIMLRLYNKTTMYVLVFIWPKLFFLLSRKNG